MKNTFEEQMNALQAELQAIESDTVETTKRGDAMGIHDWMQVDFAKKLREFTSLRTDVEKESQLRPLILCNK
jgi:hypothetical protein